MSDFISRMKDFFDKSVEVSKDAFLKAGDKVQDFGDKSVTRIEISQLETQIKKQMQALGQKTYTELHLNNAKIIKSSDEEISKILAEIAQLKIEIEDRERKLAIAQ